MEKYVVPIYGFNEEIDNKERLGSAFLVRPNFLITAGHVILDDTGQKYLNKGFYYNDKFIQLPAPLYLKYEQEYRSDDHIYFYLAIYSLRIDIPEAFVLSTRNIAWNEQYTSIGYGVPGETTLKNRSQFEVTISFPNVGYKNYEWGKWIEMINCLEIKEILSPGDSGSPIFTNEEVIGMIVYGIKDSKKDSPSGGFYGTVAIKALFINETLVSLVSC